MSHRKLVKRPIQPQSETVAELPVSDPTTIQPPKDPFRIPQTGVRDGILKALQGHLPTASYTPLLVAHLKKFGKDTLDAYTDLEFVLEPYNVTLKFESNRADNRKSMIYKMPYLDTDMEPDPTFLPPKSWFGGWF
jgi:hypothetical protein